MKDLNLLPQKYVSINKARQQFLIAAALSMAAVGVILVSYLVMAIYHNRLSAHNDDLLQEIQRYSIVNEIINENSTLKNQINSREQFLKGVAPKIPVYDYMGYLGGCVPQGSNVKLTSLIYGNNSISIDFKIKDYDSLSSYVKKIRETALFYEVKIQGTNREDKGGISATVLCNINPANQ